MGYVGGCITVCFSWDVHIYGIFPRRRWQIRFNGSVNAKYHKVYGVYHWRYSLIQPTSIFGIWIDIQHYNPLQTLDQILQIRVITGALPKVKTHFCNQRVTKGNIQMYFRSIKQWGYKPTGILGYSRQMDNVLQTDQSCC